MSKLAPRRPETLPGALSPREVEILRMIATCASNQEVAARLYITEGTVKNHVTEILGKLGVKDRTQGKEGKRPGLV
jgi:DNA-binding NarL/FixJ family response regulator